MISTFFGSPSLQYHHFSSSILFLLIFILSIWWMWRRRTTAITVPSLSLSAFLLVPLISSQAVFFKSCISHWEFRNDCMRLTAVMFTSIFYCTVLSTPELHICAVNFLSFSFLWPSCFLLSYFLWKIHYFNIFLSIIYLNVCCGCVLLCEHFSFIYLLSDLWNVPLRPL